VKEEGRLALWLQVLLVLSLLGNAAEVGYYTWSRWNQMRQWRGLFNWLENGAAMMHDRVMVSRFEPQLDSLSDRQTRWKYELEWTRYEDRFDTATFRQALDSMENINRQIYRVLFLSCQALPDEPDPKRRRTMTELWRRQMGLPEEHPKARAR